MITWKKRLHKQTNNNQQIVLLNARPQRAAISASLLGNKSNVLIFENNTFSSNDEFQPPPRISHTSLA